MFFSLSTTASDDPLMPGFSLQRNYSSLVQNGERSITCLWFCGSEASPEVQCWLKVRSSTRKGQVVCVSKPPSTTGQRRLSRKLRIRLLPRWELPCTRCLISPSWHSAKSGVWNNSNINSQMLSCWRSCGKPTLAWPRARSRRTQTSTPGWRTSMWSPRTPIRPMLETWGGSSLANLSPKTHLSTPMTLFQLRSGRQMIVGKKITFKS